MASLSEIMAKWLGYEAESYGGCIFYYLDSWRLVAVSRAGSLFGLFSVGLSVASPLYYYYYTPSSLPTFMYIDALVYS
jgi:hypothetical protein